MDKALVILFFISASGVVGCRTIDRSDSDLNITNGVFITKQSENPVDAVVQIIRRNGKYGTSCSGTIVSSNTIITAAHCFLETAKVPNMKSDGKLIHAKTCINIGKYKDLCTDQVYVNPDYAGNIHGGYDLGNGDVAALYFEDAPFKEYIELNTAHPKEFENLSIFLIGFSSVDLQKNTLDAKGSKRWGYNSITKIEEDKQKLFSPVTTKNSSTSPGDSGGPMLNHHCQLIGVCSGGTYAFVNSRNTKIQNVHSSIAQKSTQDWLERINGRLVDVCGLKGMREGSCNISNKYVLSTDLYSKNELPCVPIREFGDGSFQEDPYATKIDSESGKPLMSRKNPFLGITLGTNDGLIYIKSIDPGGIADAYGLPNRHYIMSINGRPTKTHAELVNTLREEAGDLSKSVIVIKLHPGGTNTPVDFEIILEHVEI